MKVVAFLEKSVCVREVAFRAYDVNEVIIIANCVLTK